MRLAHPGKGCVITDLHGISPELLQSLLHDSVQNLSVYTSAILYDPVNFPLVSRFHEMRHKIVIVCIADHAGQYPSAEPLILIGLQKIMGHQQFIHGGRSFHKIGGHICIEYGLGAVACLEMTGMSQLVGECEHICHTLIPGQQDERVLPVRARTESAC